MMTFRVFSWFSVFLPACLLALTTPAAASVVMLNTRVIFPGDAQSQTLQFTNNDKIPYVMQMWSDINNPSSTPDNADAPFITVPAMFRIEPNVGQSVRLIFTGKNLPQDRESVFYLNSVQVPPKNTSGGENQMMVILKNRVKIFYRPKSIIGGPDNVTRQLHFKLKQDSGRWVLNVKNESGYYATVIAASVVTGKNEVSFPAGMISPKSSVDWALNKQVSSIANASKVKFTVINDYGGQTKAEADLNH